MNFIERVCIALRHSPVLGRAHWLWSATRPCYNSMVRSLGRGGLERVMNGTDRILIAPELRGVSEVYEPDVWKHAMSNVRPGEVIADVGAFIGLYTIALGKRVGPTGHVIAFEPDEGNFQTLQRHIELNNLQTTVKGVKAAVGTQDGQIWFTCNRDSQNSVAIDGQTNARPVQMMRLDSFFEGQRLDILKVDVEGFEEDVLKGAAAMLSDVRRAPRLIYLEVHPYNWHLCGTTSESLLSRLHNSDYNVETLNGQACSGITDYGEVVACRRS